MYRTLPWGSFPRVSLGSSLYVHGTVLDSLRQRHPVSAPRQYTWPATSHPTPYEVMGIPKDSRYSKSRYFDLVKLYHPDRKASAAIGQLAPEERLARYRLIVEAHALLSNEHRRLIYDAYGSGWIFPVSSRGGWRRSPYMRSTRSTRSHGWRSHESPAAELEFFRYLSRNKKFLCLVVVVMTFAQACVLLSSMAKAELQMSRVDEQCRELLLRHRTRALTLRTVVAQIERLLLKRDPSGTGLIPSEGSCHRDELPLCLYSEGD
ncbi:hypothetical protein N7488_008804 [Penicillium malachiteum]|nr:hypothetical protein N7488_008804 [Penicillium malachiteum]